VFAYDWPGGQLVICDGDLVESLRAALRVMDCGCGLFLDRKQTVVFKTGWSCPSRASFYVEHVEGALSLQ